MANPVAQAPHDGTVEGRVTSLEIRMAVTENNVQKIETKLDNIDKNLNKLLWLVGGAIILAVLKMTFGGELF